MVAENPKHPEIDFMKTSFGSLDVCQSPLAHDSACGFFRSRNLLGQSFIGAVALAVIGSLSASQSTWLGGVDDDWTNAANWSDGVPSGEDDTAVFGPSSQTTVDLGTDLRSIHSLHFGRNAPSYTFTGDEGFRFQGPSGSTLVRMDFGAATQNFDTPLVSVNTGTNSITRYRNDSLEGIFNAQGPLTRPSGGNVRLIHLRGIGGGTLAGITDLPYYLTSVAGGGHWNFTGSNVHAITFNKIFGGGSTMTLDFRDNNDDKFSPNGSSFLRGLTMNILGNESGTSTTLGSRVNADHNISVGESYGFANRIVANSTGAGSLTVNLSQIGITTLESFLHLSGNADFQAASFFSSLNGFLLLNNAYATIDEVEGEVVARDLTVVDDPATDTINGSGTYFSVSLDAGTTTRNSAATTVKGMQIQAAGEGEWQINNTFLAGGTGRSMIYVSDHDFTISTTLLGTNDSRGNHFLNLGEGQLTLDGPLNTGTFRKAGEGDIILTSGTTNTPAQVHVGEGRLIFRHSDVMGDDPTANNVYVQGGATLRLENNIGLHANTTLNLHGLGFGDDGALSADGASNSVSGNVVLGITSRVTATAGSQLEISGNVAGIDDGDHIALVTDGPGNIILSGTVTDLEYGILHQGAGVLELSGNNTYAGGTRITNGVVRAGHANALAGGAVSIEGATNTVTLEIETGVELLVSDITLEGDAILSFRLDGNYTGTRINVSGDQLGGGIYTVDINDAGGMQLGVYELMTVAGLFEASDFMLGSLPAQFAGSSLDWQDGALTLNLVPEPSGALLVLLGTAGWMLINRRRRATPGSSQNGYSSRKTASSPNGVRLAVDVR